MFSIIYSAMNAADRKSEMFEVVNQDLLDSLWSMKEGTGDALHNGSNVLYETYRMMPPPKQVPQDLCHGEISLNQLG